jgi:hypothetical protein
MKKIGLHDFESNLGFLAENEEEANNQPNIKMIKKVSK